MNGFLDPRKVSKYFKDQKPPNLEELKKNGKKFTDPYFPPTMNTLFGKDEKGNFIDPWIGEKSLLQMQEDDPNSRTGKYEWKRVTDIIPTWEMFEGEIEFKDIAQGSIGDCYFLSALAALAKYPYLIEEKFRIDKFNLEGYYEVILFIDGEWQVVFVDDYFPYNKKKKEFAYAKPHNNELWAIILEKAWAKVNGGYALMIGGVVSEAVSALTGFPLIKLNHEILDPEDIFDKIEEGTSEKTIMGVGSIHDKSVAENMGILSSHAYTILEGKAYEDKEIYLIKLRNPWGKKEWIGEWGDESYTWSKNEELKKYFGHEIVNDGIFWISIDHYVNYFISTSISYLLYGAIIKQFFFEKIAFLSGPAMFNLYFPSESKISFSALFKKRRFNREMKFEEHPCILIVCKYDQNNQIEKMYSKYEYAKDLEFVEILEKGHYFIWLYCDIQHVQGDNNFKYVFRISSNHEFNVEFIGIDKKFKLIQYLVMNNYRRIGQAFISSSKSHFIGSDQMLKDSGLLNNIVFNLSSTEYLALQVSITEQVDISILPPFAGMANISIRVPPQQGIVILGLATRTGGNYKIKLRSSFVNGGFEAIKPKKYEKYFKQHLDESKNEDLGIRTGRYKFVEKERLLELQNIGKKHIDKATTSQEVEENELLEKYPREMELLLIYIDTDEELEKDTVWKILDNSEQMYIGQVKRGTNICNGRGILRLKAKNHILIGYFVDNRPSIKGMIFDQNYNLNYSGDFRDGKMEGFGQMIYSENEHGQPTKYYYGEMKGDTPEGRGYEYVNKKLWDGFFKNGIKHGIGLRSYDNSDVKELVEYVNDTIKKVIKLKDEDIEKINKTKHEERFKVYNQIYQKYLKEQIEEEQEDISDDDVDNYKICELDSPIEESEEEKKDREYMEKVDELKQKDPFMFEQIFELIPREGEKRENFEYLDYGNGKKYIGQTLNHVPEGRGAYYNGELYFIGFYEKGKPNGFFKIFNKDKVLLRKGFTNKNYNIYNGSEYYQISGEMYKGDFKNGKKHGAGTMFYDNGTFWIGTFKDGNPVGEGILYFNQGVLVTKHDFNCGGSVPEINDRIGYTEENIPFKREIYSIPNSVTFFETYSKEYPEVIEKIKKLLPARILINNDISWGYLTFAGNITYIGQIKGKAIAHGRGAFIYPREKNKYYLGFVEYNYLKGEGTFYNSDWTVSFTGEFEKNKRNGFGRDYDSEGNVFHGMYRNDKEEGLGVMMYKNGEQYLGNYQDGKRHGIGYLVSKDKKTFQEVTYEKGNTVSQGNITQCYKKKYKKVIESQINQIKEEDRKFLKLTPTEDKLVLNVGIKDDIKGTYIGEMNQIGFKHGRGYFREHASQKTYLGYYVNNVLEGEVYVTLNGKPYYKGNYKNGKPYGKGIYYDHNLTGEFDEVGEGEGAIDEDRTGLTWKGHFYGWRADGIGRSYDSFGVVQEINKYILGCWIKHNE